MRIAWLTNNINQLGGVEQVICGLSDYFAGELKYEVQIISINSQSSHIFYSLNDAVRVVHCGLDWREQTFRKLKKLVGTYMDNLDADSLITCHPTISYAVLMNKRKFKGRIVVTQHSACIGLTRKRLWCNALMFRLADQFVVLSENDRHIYQKMGCDALVIPNANFRPVQARSSLNTKMILAAGRIEEVKGFDRLVQAFAQIADGNQEWKLCICGGGTLEGKLKEQIEQLHLTERIILPGSVQNMEDYFQQASVFALSSRSEGFSLVLVEAMSFGVPTVSFALPAPEEILNNGGGFLVPQGDIGVFAEKLEQLIQDDALRKETGECAYAAAEQYRIPCIAARWTELFEQLTRAKSLL